MSKKTKPGRSYSQLTIDGGEVSHPPPPPKAKCCECDKLITLITGGWFRRHKDPGGEECPGGGQRPNR